MAVNLDPSFGRIEVSYLTGQGRAVDDLYLEITRQTVQTGPNANVVRRDSLSPLNLRLNGFQTLTARLNVPFANITGDDRNSLNLTQFVFDPNRLLRENAQGDRVDTGFDLSSAAVDLPFVLDARIRAFPGRDANVQVRVSDATFTGDTNATFAFDRAGFRQLNVSDSGIDPDAQGRLASRLSDFVRFPLTNLLNATDRPDLRNDPLDTGNVTPNGAQYVYLSGDNIALSGAAGGFPRIFQELGEQFPDAVIGKFSEASGQFPGTYDLRDANPVDINDPSLARVVSLFGRFRDYRTVLSGGTSFEIVMFPNSGETYSFENAGNAGVRGREGDIVAFHRNANEQIDMMYVGGVDFGAGTFSLFPVRFLGGDPTDADAIAAEIQGTVSSLRDVNGSNTGNYASVRSFSYAFTTPTLPTGFTGSGNATVFRK